MVFTFIVGEYMNTDPELGKAVEAELIRAGLETPRRNVYHGLNNDSKKQAIASAFLDVMKVMELDYTDDSLKDTPKRIAKMYVDEVMYGLNYDNFPKIMTFENSFHDAGMVVEKNIRVNSMCSHHFVPTIGTATIGYIPKNKVIGLSKLNRVIDFFARRPQEQERFVMQVHAVIKFLLDTNDVAVYIDAKHYCVSWRGVKDEDSSFVTSKLSGAFLDDSVVRSEFYNIARGA